MAKCGEGTPPARTMAAEAQALRSMGARAQPDGMSRFTRADRLRRRREFLAVQREGRRVYTAHFILVVRPAPDPQQGPRLGVTVTKKVANAVGRNRVKRLAREVFRRHRGLFPPESDVVMVARAGAEALDYGRLLAEVTGARSALRDAARRSAQPRPERRAAGRKEPK